MNSEDVKKLREKLAPLYVEAIPEPLRAHDQWVTFTLAPTPNGKPKPDKIPHAVGRDGKGSSTDRGTWGSFDAALADYRDHARDAVAFALSDDDDFVAIDLDDCVDPATGQINDRAAEIVAAFGSYAETSLLGRGVHVLVKGRLSKNIKLDWIEIYASKRFIICTGDALNNAEIAERQEVLDALVARLAPEPTTPAREPEGPRSDLPPMRELMERRGFKVRANDRADCVFCSGNSDGTVSFTDAVAFCHRCNWKGNQTTLARELGLIPKEDRPVIRLKIGEIPGAIDEAETVLLDHAERLRIFQRGAELVRIIRLPEARKGGGLKRPEGVLMLEPLVAAALREAFERVARFERFDPEAKKPKRVDCPMRIAVTYQSRCGSWQLPVLSGVIAAPVMREDGSIISRVGYDAESGLFLGSEEAWLDVDESPSQKDATSALETLLAPFAQFPWVDEASKSVHGAAILTALQRRLLPACPVVGYSAPVMRTGKSQLAEGVAIIATGKPAPATTVSKDPEELRKAITSALREGHAIINLDNIEHTLASPHLAAAVTQGEYADRLLGENRMLHLPTNVLWTVTGNNLTLRGDLVSRTLLCRIDAGQEQPEERTFEIPNLPKYLVENRPRLVKAALTLLRAYHVAGRPDQKLSRWGGFDAWSDSIRAALVWAGAADPCLTRAAVLTDDPEQETASALLNAIAASYQDGSFTVKKLIDRATAREVTSDGKPGVFANADLHEAVSAVASEKGRINPNLLGWWCRRFRDRFVGGKRIRHKVRESGGSGVWYVE